MTRVMERLDYERLSAAIGQAFAGRVAALFDKACDDLAAGAHHTHVNNVLVDGIICAMKTHNDVVKRLNEAEKAVKAA